MGTRALTLYVAVGVGIAISLAALVLRARRSPTARGASPGSGAESDDERTELRGGRSAGSHAPGADGEVGATAHDPQLPVLDRKKRDELRALLWRSLGQDPPDAAPARAAYVLPEVPPWPEGPGESDDAGPGIDPKYIQDRVRNDFFPLAKKCYGDMSARLPDAGGSIVLAFDIVGNKNIGGIVEQVDVLNKSTLRDPEFIDCMRQSFLSVSFPPPENGSGMVTVEYPILFSPEDADE